MSEDHPQGCTLIEIRGVYDGWSIMKLADGTLVNRWPVDDRRHAQTQEVIERMKRQ